MKTSLLSILFLTLIQVAFAQTDREGSSDHPLIPRFGDSYIYFYEQTSFDPYMLATGKSNGSKIQSTLEVEGKVTRIFYSLSTEAGSVYEIYSNYVNALKGEGAKLLFAGKNRAACGTYFWDFLRDMDPKLQIPAYYGEEFAYIAAKFSKDGMAYYVTIIPGYGLSELGYEVTVVETKEMDQQISLEGIEKAIDETGKVSLYGILFDSGSDVLKESSFEEIGMIAQYLKNHPEKNIYVVGHTDNTGSYQLNMTLSEKRALAVTNALKTKYGISSKRMISAGVGPLAPESKNTTEEGRKKNRRVEIVLNEK